MTPLQRQQLENLLQEQARLAQAVKGFDERLRDFMVGVEKTVEPEARIDEALASVARPTPPEPVHLPPPLPPHVEPAAAAPAEAPAPLGPPDERGYRALAEATVERSRAEATRGGGAPTPWREVAPPVTPAKEPQSLEMTLGTVWLARIGIVILLTGLVFLGNYAWQHIVPHLGHGGKVALLYLAAAALGGIGAWLERRRIPSGRYPQVLMAGGAATAYYTTYAAHFVRQLRVIESPLVGGLLLLAIAGVFLWWSDRRKLQTAALLGILLSYYTSAINPLGDFTLYSSALLTVVAGVLLLRRGWAMVSWASLVGTYGSYLYWLILRGWPLIFGMGGAGIGDPVESLEVDHYNSAGNVGMLATYWTLFTATGFLAAPTVMKSRARTTYLALNNALFFALASWFMAMRHPHEYWVFALCFGCF